ncbi:MAG: hypothetical protein HYZ62_01795 [Candidatus Andersenbacteria bacterium]|nr:hypothetical protein [Candidatus Andersenbacteria bacterium]
MSVHQKLASGKWFSMTLAEQLGNVGSDFERALKWRSKNQHALFNTAAARTLELMDLTLDDKRWHNHRLAELTRLREQVCQELFESNDPRSAVGLKKYFLAMAVFAQHSHSIKV